MPLSPTRFVGDFLVRLANVVSHILFNYYFFFLPFQVFLKLRHESKVEHIFVSGNSGKQFEIILVKFLSYDLSSVFVTSIGSCVTNKHQDAWKNLAKL